MLPFVAPNERIMPASSVRLRVCNQKVPITPKQRLTIKKMAYAMFNLI